MRRLSGRAARKPVCVGAGGAEFGKLAADAAHDRGIATLRPFARRRPWSVVLRTMNTLAETVVEPVGDHPACSAVFALGHIDMARKEALLRRRVIASCRRLALLHGKAPLPHGLAQSALMKTPSLKCRAVGVKEVHEKRLLARCILESHRRGEAAARGILRTYPASAVVVVERLESKDGIVAVARTAPRKILEPRAVLEERPEKFPRALPVAKGVPTALLHAPQGGIASDRKLLLLRKIPCLRRDRRKRTLDALKRKLPFYVRCAARARLHLRAVLLPALDVLSRKNKVAHRALPPNGVAPEIERILKELLAQAILAAVLTPERVFRHHDALLLGRAEVFGGDCLERRNIRLPT